MSAKRKSDIKEDDKNKRVVSDREITSYDRRIAFLMATHPRLGASSPAKVLLSELFKLICSYVTQPYVLVTGGAYFFKEEHRIGLKESLRNTDRYDITNKKWKKMPSLPNSRAGQGMAYLNGNVYIIGGKKCKEWNFTALSTVEIYNPIKNTYTPGPKLNEPRSNFGCCKINNKIYAFGGSRVQTCEVFSNNSWSFISPLPSLRTSVTAVAFENKVLLLSSPTSLCTKCQAITQKFDVEHNCHCICVIAEIYDPEKDSYNEVPHPCTSLSDMSLAIIGNEAYSVGGESQPEHFWFGGCSTSNSASDEVWKYTGAESGWKSVVSLPEPLLATAVVGYENDLYTFGGAGGNEYPGFTATQRSYKFDSGYNAWLKLESMIVDRLEAAAVVYYD